MMNETKRNRIRQNDASCDKLKQKGGKGKGKGKEKEINKLCMFV